MKEADETAAEHTESMEMFSAFMHGSHEMSVVLKSHLFAEAMLERVLINSGLQGSQLARWSFFVKLQKVEEAGLLPAGWFSALRALNSIRNRFAHERGHRLDAQQLRSLNFGWGQGQERSCDAAISKSIKEGLATIMFYLLENLQSLAGAQQSATDDGSASASIPQNRA